MCKMQEIMALNREHNGTLIYYHIKTSLNLAFGVEAPFWATIVKVIWRIP